MQNEQINGISLIEKILDFISLVPDHNDWNIEKLKNNPPRLIRLKQIEVLLQILVLEVYDPNDIKLSIENTINGQFLLHRPEHIYNELFDEMETTIRRYKPKLKKSEPWLNSLLQDNFNHLIRYMIELNRISNYHSGVLVLSYPYFYAYLLSEEISANINSEKIISFLGNAIDPQKRVFNSNSLIKDFNYPSEDLTEIDFEWM
jgi:hypothetical protein